GVGINRELLPFIFDRFRQGDSSSTRTQGGLGIGLALVRHLTELHGGTVTGESAGEDQGATFRVKLPLAAASIEAPGVHPTALAPIPPLPRAVAARSAGARRGRRPGRPGADRHDPQAGRGRRHAVLNAARGAGAAPFVEASRALVGHRDAWRGWIFADPEGPRAE